MKKQVWAIFTPGGSHDTKTEADTEEKCWNQFLSEQDTVPEGKDDERAYFKAHAEHAGYEAVKIKGTWFSEALSVPGANGGKL